MFINYIFYNSPFDIFCAAILKKAHVINSENLYVMYINNISLSTLLDHTILGSTPGKLDCLTEMWDRTCFMVRVVSSKLSLYPAIFLV